jgi:hypothetical protein
VRHWFIIGPIALAALWLAGCTTNQVGVVPTPAPINVAAASKLQLAIGTANIAAQNSQQVTGLNVVATFRQANGNNATGENAPILTGPAGLNLAGMSCGPVNYPPAVVASAPPNVFSGATIGQLIAALAAKPTTVIPAGLGQFGPQVGVYGYGFGAYNSIPQVDLRAPGQAAGIGACILSGYPFTSHIDSRTLQGGTALNSAELALPIGTAIQSATGGNFQENGQAIFPALLYAQSAGAVLPITSYGGPPAWPSPQGYGNFGYFDGYPEGFMDMGTTPIAGTYQLSASYPTSADFSQTATVTATAKLPSAGHVLPAMPPPVLTMNLDGSGFVTLDVPPGLTETIVNVSNEDCDFIDRPGEPTDHYSIVTKKSGIQVLYFAANLGPPTPAGVPTHTFCTQSDLAAYDAYLTSGGQSALATLPIMTYVQAVGFDYPAYESSYPFNESEAPPIAGVGGTADITTSYPIRIVTTLTLPTGASQ